MPEPPEDPKLVAALARLDLGPEVPPPLRAAVGAALAWVDALVAEAAGSGATRPR
jgi:type III secretion system FlhB-like substrate exporter